MQLLCLGLRVCVWLCNSDGFEELLNDEGERRVLLRGVRLLGYHTLLLLIERTIAVLGQIDQLQTAVGAADVTSHIPHHDGVKEKGKPGADGRG